MWFQRVCSFNIFKPWFVANKMMDVNKNSEANTSELDSDTPPSLGVEPGLSNRVKFLEQRVKRLEEVCLELTQILSGAIEHIHSFPRR